MPDLCRSCRDIEIDFATGPPTRQHPEGSTTPLNHGHPTGDGQRCPRTRDPAAPCTHERANLAAWRDGPLLRFRYLKGLGSSCTCEENGTSPARPDPYCPVHTTHAGPDLAAGEHYAKSHFATCPRRDLWRSAGRRGQS